jgi:hypothetical protein
MPKLKNRSRLDDILRDEAKDMLGRTPAQGWLKPERVELSLPRRRTAHDYLNPYLNRGADDLISDAHREGGGIVGRPNVPADLAKLEFVQHPPRAAFPPQAHRVRPSPDILERFLQLADAPVEQIHKFAARFGALLIFCRVEERKIPGKLFIVERCETWRYFASSMRSLLRIASCFHTDRKPDPSDWDQIGARPTSLVPAKEKPYDPLSPTRSGGEDAWIAMTHFVRKGADRDPKMWALLLNGLLELGRVRPWLVWEGAGSARRPKLLFSGPNLLSYLALELCLRASKHDAFAVCSYCNQQYAPLGRAPKSGQRNFCPDCRARGVPVRLAQRSLRERLREANLADT